MKMYLNFKNKKGWENLHLKSGLENWDMAQELELATTTDQVAEDMENNLSKYFLHEPYKHHWSNSVTGAAVQPPLPKEQDESDVQPHLWMWVNPNLVCPITGYLIKGVPGKPVHLVAPAPKAAVTKPTSVKPRPPVAAALQTSSGQCVSVPLVTAAPKVSARKYSSVKAVALVNALQTSPVASVSIPSLAASDAVTLQASTVKNVPRKPVFPVLLAAVPPKTFIPVKPVPPVSAASKASNRKHASGKTVPPVADTMQVSAHTPGKNMSLEAAALVDSYQKPVSIAYKQLCPKEEVLLCSSKAKLWDDITDQLQESMVGELLRVRTQYQQLTIGVFIFVILSFKLQPEYSH